MNGKDIIKSLNVTEDEFKRRISIIVDIALFKRGLRMQDQEQRDKFIEQVFDSFTGMTETEVQKHLDEFNALQTVVPATRH